MVLLCFVALNGYNALAKYSWRVNEVLQEDEIFPFCIQPRSEYVSAQSMYLGFRQRKNLFSEVCDPTIILVNLAQYHAFLIPKGDGGTFRP